MVRRLVRVKLKVGPKGQIVIPKVFREAYGIKEGDYVVVEPLEEGLLIRRRGTERLVQDILAWKKRVGGKVARMGELRKVDLEVEFD